MGMTREEAVKAIKSHCYFANLVPVGKEALDMAIKALQQEPRWVPVSERLPGIRQNVLCQCRANIYLVLRLNNNSDWECIYPHTTYMQSFVIAWMPLPKPYKPQESEK